MTPFVMARQAIKSFYSKYEAFVYPVIKFLIGLVCLLIINKKLGYMPRLNNFAIVLMAALACSFMPLNFTVFVSAIFVLMYRSGYLSRMNRPEMTIIWMIIGRHPAVGLKPSS